MATKPDHEHPSGSWFLLALLLLLAAFVMWALTEQTYRMRDIEATVTAMQEANDDR